MERRADLCPNCFDAEWRGGPCVECDYVADPDAFPTAIGAGTGLTQRYVVGRVLGRPGGFGVTYLGFDRTLERRIAIKELMPRGLVARHGDGVTLRVQTQADGALFAETLDSFLTEARTVAKMSHPNVVRILDYFEANGTAYFVMEYYEGETLDEYAERLDFKVQWQDVLKAMVPILEALDHVHSHGILHRDIKPQNIYLAKGDKPVLLDFGAARLSLGEQTQTLTNMLTPGYAPLEQYQTRGHQGPPTDVYGCAATIYYLVTGNVPIQATDRLMGSGLADPSRVNASLPSGAAAAILAGMAMRIEDRPATAGIFASQLKGDAAAPADESTLLWTGLPDLTPPSLGELPASDSPTVPAKRRAVEPVPDPVGDPEATVVAGGAPEPLSEALVGPLEDHDPRNLPVRSVPPPTPRSRPKRIVIPATIVLLLGGAYGAYSLMAARGLALADEPASPLVAGDTTPVGQIDTEPVASAPGDNDQTPNPQVGGVEADETPELTPSAREAREAPSPPSSAQTAGPPDPPTPSTFDPTPEAAAAENPRNRVLVVIYGDELGARDVELEILDAMLSSPEVQPIDGTSLALVRAEEGAARQALAGDFIALSRLGAEHGAEFLVVGDLTGSVVKASGPFYSGSAALSLTMYRVSTGAIVGNETFRVGMGGLPAKAGTSETDALLQAASSVGREGAVDVRRWLRQALR